MERKATKGLYPNLIAIYGQEVAGIHHMAVKAKISKIGDDLMPEIV